MSKSVKAALFSALIFPGAGHFLLKYYVHGTVLAGISLGSVYYLTTTAVEKAMLNAEKIQSGDTPMDVTAITNLVASQPTGNNPDLLTIATTALFICWIGGVLDSYRLGRRQD